MTTEEALMVVNLAFGHNQESAWEVISALSKLAGDSDSIIFQ